ncbi:Heterokaryon incompatibility protein [Lasiodiplodia theobromae]|uniref:Heterokaryon incompatibility protein n=1 Tax=Lasiodiplodia theobromae TaxID=45133 RepID=UPI0015C2DD1B|nr:Heterokaryon incompatibility protein [Lasiodiplodia theobromae]KAF4539635.1 Heterokaryon incompatibility protein [Lasiodiplodia theobromae]
MDRTRSRFPIQHYFAHLKVYSDRSLTFQSDIYNAFIGIANTVYGADVLVYGLPRHDFDQALLWIAGDYAPDGRDAENITLPSWSWASVDGQIEVLDYDCFSFCGTLVQWTVCVESEGQLSLERIDSDNAPISWIEQQNLSIYRNWEPDMSLDGGHGLSPSLYMALVWGQDCIGAPRPSGFWSFNNHTFDEMSTMAHDLWPTYNAYYRTMDSGKDQSQRDTTTFPSTRIPGSLIGRVQTAILEILINSDDEWKLVYKGRQIGVTYLSTSSWRRGSTIKAIALSVFNMADPERNNQFYLQKFSSCYPSIRRGVSAREENKRVVAAGEEILRDPKENLTFFDCNGEALLPPPMLRLMIIEEDGPSYRRIGLGWAYLARWVQTDRKFETVTLI